MTHNSDENTAKKPSVVDLSLAQYLSLRFFVSQHINSQFEENCVVVAV